MPKHTHALLVAILLLLPASSLLAQATSAETKSETKSEPILILEKFVTEDQKEDPNSILPTQPISILGLSKKIVDTPRSISLVSGEMIEKFNMNELADLSRFAPSTYTAFSYGVQGGLHVRGDTSDTYYGDMKKLNNHSNLKTIVGASDGVTIVRGPPSAVLGAGSVGGFMNYLPKSARASTGKYLDSLTGKFSYTTDQWGKNVVTAEAGGPLSFGDRRAGFYVYSQFERSDTYYRGQRIEDELIQATLTVDLAPSLRMEINGNYQKHLGTGIAGWNRMTQELVDNRTYQAGSPDFSLIDTDGDGWATRRELFDAGVTNNYTFNSPGNPRSNQVKPGTTAYTAENGPLALVDNVHITKLDPRNVMLERVNSGVDYIASVKLVADGNPNLIFKNNVFFEYQDYYKLSDLAYMRSGETTVLEERFSVEWNVQGLPDWLTITNLTAVNARYLDAFNNTTNVHQIFNYWDLTTYTDGHYQFRNGYTHPNEAGIDSASKSEHTEIGVGNLVDVSAFGKLNLSIGLRYDWVDGKAEGFAGLRNSGTNLFAPTSPSSAEGTDKGASLTSISLSYKILPNLVPYVTYAEPKTVVPGSTGGLSVGTIRDGDILTGASLKEFGIKGEFLDGKLYASYATYEQFRTAWSQSLNNGDGDFQQTRARGHEVELRYVPGRYFNIALAGDWTRRDKTPNNAGTFPAPPATVGLDPIQFGAGRYAIAYDASLTRVMKPPRVFSLFGNYLFGTSGWDISAGASYIAGHYATTIFDIYMPEAMLFSLDLGYRAKERWEFRLSGKNLTDELYFTSTSGSAGLIPQPGRTFTGKISYRF